MLVVVVAFVIAVFAVVSTGLPASFSKKIPDHFQVFSIFWSVFQGPFIIFQGSSKW